MAKKYYCAKCGTELAVKAKAIPRAGTVVHLVQPHDCTEDASEETMQSLGLDKEQPSVAEELRINEMFKGFDFVQKLNKATEVETPSEPGDLRPKSSRREELVTSTAPEGALGAAKSPPPSTPEREELDE